MDKQKKINRLREILPFFWNSYQHMFDVRERRAKGMIDFLLIISTFLPILSVSLYATDYFNNFIILLPIVPQLLSIVILLKFFVVNSSWVHWIYIDKKFFPKLEDPQYFEVENISVLKALEEGTATSMRENGKLIKQSRALILSSLFILISSVLFVFFDGGLLFHFSFLCLILISCIIFLFYKQKPDNSNASKVEKDTKELLNEWLNQN